MGWTRRKAAVLEIIAPALELVVLGLGLAALLVACSAIYSIVLDYIGW